MEIDKQFLKELEILKQYTGDQVVMEKYHKSLEKYKPKSEEKKDIDSDKKK